MCNWQQIYPCRLPDQEYWSDCNECGMFYILYMKVMMHGSFPGFQSQPFSIWLGQKAERTNIIIFEMCINYFESLKTIKSFPNKGCYIISICFYFNDKTVWFGTWTVWSDVCDRVIYVGNIYCFMMIICDYQFSKIKNDSVSGENPFFLIC